MNDESGGGNKIVSSSASNDRVVLQFGFKNFG